jgi:arginase
MVAVVGVPLDENSSFMRGPAGAPARIREILNAGSANLCAENGLDLGAQPGWRDLGDLSLGTGAGAITQIAQAAGSLLDRGLKVLALGGDHSVTHPLVRAHASKYPRLTILHLDAHPDLYDDFEGNPYSHASPFARIMEAGLAARLVQVGIRTMNPHQRAQADRFGVEVIEMRQWTPGRTFAFDGPVYISLDLDVLDPAFAPGVSHHEPGGLSTRDVLGILQTVQGPIVGADIVEYNPVRDPIGVTGMAAAKFYKELLARLLG